MTNSAHPRAFEVQIAHEGFDFEAFAIHDPVPTGAQLLETAHRRPAASHQIFQILSGGAMEEIRPDETVDLRVPGRERFITFLSDRSFRLNINEQPREWGKQTITGRQLKQLAGLDPADHEIFYTVIGGEDRPIGDNETFNLGAAEVERFATRRRAISIFVNTRPHQVHQRVMEFWSVVRLAYPDANPIDGTAEYTVTYSHGPRVNPAGNLVAGQSVELKGGMQFYVLVTDKS
jgi:hypothetical protein